MITWGVSGIGGVIYRGIPSKDVAIAMAIDFERYVEEDEDGEDALIRVDVHIEPDYREFPDEDPTFLVYGASHRGVGVWSETRCDACGGRKHYSIYEG